MSACFHNLGRLLQVDFRAADGLPEEQTHRYVITKKERGYAVENATVENKEPAYRLELPTSQHAVLQ